MKNISPFLNPIQWIKARRFARKNRKFDKSSYDLELFLYSRMLTNNMLHYGYFEDVNVKPETISFQQFEDAQMKYAENIISHIADKEHPVLDVGCGMGGLSHLISEKGFQIEGITPNKNQIELIAHNYDQLVAHNCKYEEFKTDKQFGTVINSESLQYIRLNEAFEKTNQLITPGGKWIIVDYFALEKKGESQKPHYLNNFYDKVEEHGWRITYEQDITPNILPTLTYIEMYVNRFLLPLKHFAYEKLRYKKPKLYYLSERLRGTVDKKIEKETKTVSSTWFKENRKYMLFVLEKKVAE